MELGINTDYEAEYVKIEEIEESIRRIAAAGFSHMHWCYEWDGDYIYSRSEMEQIRGWMDKYGLKAKSVYGSHDRFRSHAYCLNDYVCWSAPEDDLGNWRYEGVIYKKTQDPLNPDGHMCLYAPDVTVGPDGRYYLYYVLDKVPVVSVAVCDTPAGAYEFYGYVHYQDGVRLGKKKGTSLSLIRA